MCARWCRMVAVGATSPSSCRAEPTTPCAIDGIASTRSWAAVGAPPKRRSLKDGGCTLMILVAETPKAKPARSSSSKAVVRSVKRVKHESKSGLLRTSVCEQTGTSILALAGRGAARRSPRFTAAPPPLAPRAIPTWPSRRTTQTVRVQPRTRPKDATCTLYSREATYPPPRPWERGAGWVGAGAARCRRKLRRSSRHPQLSNSSSHTTTYFIWICETS